jgi:hypothetical protein
VPHWGSRHHRVCERLHQQCTLPRGQACLAERRPTRPAGDRAGVPLAMPLEPGRKSQNLNVARLSEEMRQALDVRRGGRGKHEGDQGAGNGTKREHLWRAYCRARCGT